MRCEHAFDDGAYVLGALSPAERDRYEKHLAVCPHCREAVASLAVLPGLLGRLNPSEVPMALDSPGSEQRLPRLIHTVRASRRRQRRQVVAAALVTACVAVFAGLALGTARTPIGALPTPAASSASASPSMHAMRPMPGVSITAEIALTEVREGTTVLMRCSYPAKTGHTKPYNLYLVAIDRDGESERVGSWSAAPGDELVVPGTVRLHMDELLRFEIQRKDGTPLLVYEVP